jgi:cell division protein FtsI (penicillin-binding protein 3)
MKASPQQPQQRDQRDDNPCRPRHFKPPTCAPAALDGPGKAALDTSHTRLMIAGALLALAFAVIGLRLVEVDVMAGIDGKVAHAHLAGDSAGKRADIIDRNGVLIATTLETPSLYADPSVFADKKRNLDAADAARKLVSVLPMLDYNEVYAKLTSDKKLVWLRHELTPSEEAAINQLGIPGIEFRNVEKRVYPKGNLLAHVAGYTGLDKNNKGIVEHGLAGVERGLDDELTHSRTPVQLSIDTRLQYILHDEIAHQVDEFKAEGGMGLIMDVRTGEVLALASLPDFDPTQPGTVTQNQVTLGVFEMGSVFKIFTAAMALDYHTTSMAGGYDATNPIKIGRFTIHDDHPQHRYLTVPEIFKYSSNIGSAKEALAVGAERQRAFLARLGLLSTPDFQIPELGAPLYPTNWREVNTLTIGFGHGISVSPLHIATAVSAVINGGILHHATLLKQPEGQAVPGQRVLAEETSLEMRKLLRLVVEDGTGKFAEAPGYVVGGKTGTAEKVSHKHYERKSLLSSFVGVFPVNDPRFVVMVTIDEPHGNAATHGYATGGWVSAPAVSRTIERMASLVGIPPVDEDSPEIRRALMIDSTVPQGRKIAAD